MKNFASVGPKKNTYDGRVVGVRIDDKPMKVRTRTEAGRGRISSQNQKFILVSMVAKQSFIGARKPMEWASRRWAMKLPNIEVTGRAVWLVVQKRSWAAPVKRLVREILQDP